MRRSDRQPNRWRRPSWAYRPFSKLRPRAPKRVGKFRLGLACKSQSGPLIHPPQFARNSTHVFVPLLVSDACAALSPRGSRLRAFEARLADEEAVRSRTIKTRDVLLSDPLSRLAAV